MNHQPAGLHDHVATLLDAMGGDAVAVAGTLRAEDIHGIRGSVLVHPVCRWLVRLVPDLGAVLGRDTVNVFRPGRGRAVHGAIVPLPDPVRAFADRFDDGEHPELELSMMPPRAPRSGASAGSAQPGSYQSESAHSGPDLPKLDQSRLDQSGSRTAAESDPADQLAASAEPAEPTQSLQPAEAAEPVQPTEPADPGQPADPADPASPADSSQPVASDQAGEATGAPPPVPAAPAEPRVPTQSGATESTGSKKAKRPRKPARPREREESTSGRPAGEAASDATDDAAAGSPESTTGDTTDDAAERSTPGHHPGSGEPSGGQWAPEPVAPARPTGTARTVAGAIPPRNMVTDTVRLVAVRG